LYAFYIVLMDRMDKNKAIKWQGRFGPFSCEVRNKRIKNIGGMLISKSFDQTGAIQKMSAIS
jgi:hypothetical protein